MAFDRDDRLAAFSDAPAPYAALPGRIVARELSAAGAGLGLNIGVATSAFLMPAPALLWLSETLGKVPDAAEARPCAFHPPTAVPPVLVDALGEKFARIGGIADHALLAGVSYEGGRRGHMLAFAGHRPGTEAALAKAVSEALVFSGVEAGELDVAFLSADDPALAGISAYGQRLDIPAPLRDEVQIIGGPSAPGMDPDRPPKLR